MVSKSCGLWWIKGSAATSAVVAIRMSQRQRTGRSWRDSAAR